MLTLENYMKQERKPHTNISGIKKGHVELYKRMELKHKDKEQFQKEDLMEIYNSFVVPRKRQYDRRRLTEEQVYNNASAWLDRAIAVLVRRGYLGLIFRIDVGPIEDALGEDKCLT